MYETIDLSKTEIDPEAVELVKGITTNDTRTDGSYADIIDMVKYGFEVLFMPVRFVGECECKAHHGLEIAVAPDTKEDTIKGLVDMLQFTTGRRIDVVYAPADQIDEAIREHYGEEPAPLQVMKEGINTFVRGPKPVFPE